MNINNNTNNLTPEQLQQLMLQQQMMQMQNQGINNQQNIGQYTANNMSYGEMQAQNAMSNFVPLMPITVHKDYITTMVILSAIIIMMQTTGTSSAAYIILGFIAMLVYNVHAVSKIRRMGFRLTMTGCLLTDAIIFLVCTVIFVFVTKLGLLTTINSLTWWCVQCVIAQVITNAILDSKEKHKLNKMKSMEKQRKQYERKVNKIYGNK